MTTKREELVELWNTADSSQQWYTLEVGTLVRARKDVWDDGKGPTDMFPTPSGYKGDIGIVEHSGEVPCVRFFSTAYATDVMPSEVEALSFDATAEYLSGFDTAITAAAHLIMTEYGPDGVYRSLFDFIEDHIPRSRNGDNERLKKNHRIIEILKAAYRKSEETNNLKHTSSISEESP